MAKPNNWKEISGDEIRSSIDAMKAELFTLKCEYKFAKKIEKPHRIRSIRRDIARALTEIQSRHLVNTNTSRDQA